MLTSASLRQLIKNGVMQNVAEDAVGCISIDVRLHHILMLEKKPLVGCNIIIPRQTKMSLIIKDLKISPYVIKPKEFLLGGLIEYFNMPLDHTGLFYLDSTMARDGIEHSASILIQPGWSGRLTLELLNVSRYHHVRLLEGMKIGKIVFYKHEVTSGYQGSFQNQQVICG